MNYRLAEPPWDVPTPIVRKGDTVKLMFEHYDGDEHVGGESMFVAVTDVTDADCRGQLLNTSVFNDHLRWGDAVSFRARHVLGPHWMN